MISQITTVERLEGYQVLTISDCGNSSLLAMRDQDVLAEFTTTYMDHAWYICHAAEYYDRVQASRRWKRWILRLLGLWENH